MLSILNANAAEAQLRVPVALDRFDAEEPDGFDPLRDIASAVGRQVEARGVLLAWHGAGDPVIAFASGACAASNEGGAFALARACRALSQCRDSNPFHERMASGSPEAVDALTICVKLPRTTVTLTTLHLSLDLAERRHHGEVLTTIRQVLESFFRLWQLRNDTLQRMRDLKLALDRSDVATLLVDRRCRIRFANSVGHELLQRKDGVRASGEVLAAAGLADTMRLQAAVSHVCAQRENGTSAAPAPVIALNRAKGRPLLAAVMASDAAADDAEPAAVVCLFDPERDLTPLIEPACNLYRLSPVESRLACLIADGTSLAEAAKTLHVREQTARSYLKQIFLKTDTRRQAELVWLLLKSSVRTAPGCRTSFV